MFGAKGGDVFGGEPRGKTRLEISIQARWQVNAGAF